MPDLQSDVDYPCRMGLYKHYRNEWVYCDKKSIRRMRKSIRYDHNYNNCIYEAAENIIIPKCPAVNGVIGTRIIDFCVNALTERADDLKENRAHELSYYVHSVARARPSRTMRQIRQFYRAQRYFMYKITESLESLAMVYYLEQNNVHALDRFTYDHPVYTIDPALTEAVEIIKVLYALEN